MVPESKMFRNSVPTILFNNRFWEAPIAWTGIFTRLCNSDFQAVDVMSNLRFSSSISSIREAAIASLKQPLHLGKPEGGRRVVIYTQRTTKPSDTQKDASPSPNGHCGPSLDTPHPCSIGEKRASHNPRQLTRREPRRQHRP